MEPTNEKETIAPILPLLRALYEIADVEIQLAEHPEYKNEIIIAAKENGIDNMDIKIKEMHDRILKLLEQYGKNDPQIAELLSGILNTAINYKRGVSQGELFPPFKPQKEVELKRDFALNFGGLEKIEKNYKHLLTEKLSSGLTLQQHIDRVKNWFSELHGDNLGNWIKLFAYVQAVKEFSESGNEATNFREIGPGRYCFSIKQDKQFFSYFIRPDKKSGQFTSKAKAKFLKWLHDNQGAIEFPMIFNGEVWNVPMRIYQYAENVSSKQILFTVDTNILESEFKDYVSIKTNEVDAIDEAWETMTDQNQDFLRLRLNSFSDIPLKFLLTLKNIYNRGGNYKNENFVGNIQKLSAESLDAHLGGFADRVKKHLKNRNRMTTGKTAKLPGHVSNLILETTFTIAKERKWLLSMPGYENKIYKFNINAGYFDQKNTARRLKGSENP